MSDASETDRPLVDFRQTLFTNVALAGVGLVTGALAARLLGPKGRGDLAAIQLWPTILAAVAMIGMPEALAFFSARRPGDAGSYLSASVVLAFLSSAVFVAIGLLVLPLALESHGEDVISGATGYLLIVPLYATAILPIHALRGTGAFTQWNVLRLAPTLLWLVVLVGFGLAGVAEPSSLAMGYLLGLAGLGIVTFFTTKPIVPPRPPTRPACADLLRFGLPAVGSTLPRLLNLRLDQLIMTVVLPARSLGLYVVAVAWSSSVSPILIAIGLTLFPHVASREDSARAVRMFSAAARLSAFTAMATSAALALVTPLAVRLLFSDAYQSAVAPAAVLVAAGALEGYNFILAEGIRGLGRPMVPLKAELVGLLATGIGLAVLLKRFDTMGAAIASLAGYGSVTLALLRHLTREEEHSSWRDWVVPSGAEIRNAALRLRTVLLKLANGRSRG